MTITNSVKRFAAAALAVIMVAGAAPAALGGGMKLFDTAIVASAEEKSESIKTTGDNSFTGNHFSIIGNGNYHDTLGIYLGGYGGPTITISALNGETISKIEAVIGHAQNVGSDTVEADNGTVSGDLTQDSTITVSDIDSSSVTLSFTSSEWGHLVLLKRFVIYYEVTDVSGINLNKTSTTLTIGDSETLQATVLPDDAFYKTVTWSSDNEEVATVDESGKVTAVKAGTATITVTATNGTDTEDDDKTATCKVTVNKPDSAVTEAPTANELTYNGNGQDLVTAGKAEGGTLVYALGESADTAPEADAFSENIPGGKDVGTYYVWYKVIGDANHNDTKPVCVEVSIADKKIDISEGTVTVDTENKTVTVKADGETVPESEYHVIYFTYEEIEGGESLTRVGTDFPTEPGTYIAGIVANEDSLLYIGENRSEPFTIEAPEESSEDESTPEESKPEESKPDSTPAPAPVDQNQGTNPATGAAAGMGLAALAAAAAVVIKKKNK